MDISNSSASSARNSNIAAVSSEAEWLNMVISLPRERSYILAQLIVAHREQFVDVFYATLLQDAEAAAFLEQNVVQERLHNSLSQWLMQLFDCDNHDAEAFARTQRKIGEVHARIDVPIHIVMQGARLLRNEICAELQRQVKDQDTLVQLINHVGNTINIAIEIMSQAFVKGARKNARTDEAYRAFALSQDFPLERESQRAALMEWSQSLLLDLYSHSNSGLPPLLSSDFGLWLQHKADLMFAGSTVLKDICSIAHEVDQKILPAMEAARKSTPTEVAAQLTSFQNAVSRLKYLLSDLFHAATAMESGRDPLTRTLNRRFMPSILTREVRMATTENMQLSVLMVDIDHFKKVNDTYGHIGGDAVLKQVAEVILMLCRPSDFVFRFGGEEFLVALVETDEERAYEIAEDLRMRIAQSSMKLPDGSVQQLTLSIGVSTFNGHPDYSLLVESADKALYRAKQNGRNRTEKAAMETGE